MENIFALLAVIIGLLIRLAIPIALTALLIFFLRKLDAHWQAEAELPQPDVQTIECWKIKNCSPEQIKTCVAYQATSPCWQVKRLPNGYLREECLSCEIFTQAPMPAFKTEPRRI
jgi:hypothetical protein